MSARLGFLKLGKYSTNFYKAELQKLLSQKEQKVQLLEYELDFETLNQFLPDQYDHLKSLLSQPIATLQKAQLDFLLIPNITLHNTFDLIHHQLPLIHPIKASIDFLKQENVKSLILLGTQFTMNNQPLIKQYESEGIEVTPISKEWQKQVDEIRLSVYNNDTNYKLQTKFAEVLSQLSKENSILLACTELSTLYQKMSSFQNVYDMAQLQFLKLENQLANFNV